MCSFMVGCGWTWGGCKSKEKYITQDTAPWLDSGQWRAQVLQTKTRNFNWALLARNIRCQSARVGFVIFTHNRASMLQ